LDAFDHVFLLGDTGSCCHVVAAEADGDGGSARKAAALAAAGPAGWRQLYVGKRLHAPLIGVLVF
jgi:hypothetical protein